MESIRSVKYYLVLIIACYLVNNNALRWQLSMYTRSPNIHSTRQVVPMPTAFLTASSIKYSNYYYTHLFSSSDSKESLPESSDELSVLIASTKEYEEEALECLANSGSSKEVEAFRVLFLGKNGKITGMLKSMRQLKGADKPKLGEVVNIAKSNIEAAIDEAKERVLRVEEMALFAKEDLGQTVQIPGNPVFFPSPGSRHPINLVMELAASIFQEIGYEIIEGPEESPEIENDFFNFEALGMPFDHPARDMQDTFYIDKTNLTTNETLLLRTHTSAVQIRQMEKRTPPFKIVAPGRVYRKDDVDATHYPIFHQVEILAIDEIGKLTVPHLLGTVKYFLQKMFGPDIELKYRASYFPFTEPSMEVDVFFRGR